jgi:predicted RNA-binding Zn ribbon-like protein
MAKIQTNQESWKFVGGRLCLDFINTVGGRLSSGAILRDKLTAYDDLLEWSRLAGMVNQTESRSLAKGARSHKKDSDATLARSILLREALYRIFNAAAEGRRLRPADVDTLSRELRIARTHQRLTHAEGAFRWAWDHADLALDRLIWPLALSAADLLTSADLSRLRQCERTDCGWLFLDTSRNRSRHWCDMKDCGNRAKVSRFRQRHRHPVQ